jgi:ATP-dependent protease ClpP protease subunit
MPKSDVKPVERIEPPEEAWRDFAEQIGGGDWYRVSNFNGVCHVYIFGEINFGPHWNKLGDDIADAKDIHLTVNSLGGDSIFALNFYDAYAGRVSETRIIARCHSAALTIALTGRKIVMRRDAKIMLHAPHSFCYASASTMESKARQLANATKRIFDILKLKTELPNELIESWLDGADVYFTAEQAKAYGLIDEITEPPAPAGALDLAASKLIPAPPAPEIGPTDDEEFIFDLLRAVTKDGAIKVRSKRNFARELKSFAQNLTIEEKSN